MTSATSPAFVPQSLHTHDMFDDQEQEGKEAKDDEDDREEDQNQQDRIGPLCPTRVSLVSVTHYSMHDSGFLRVLQACDVSGEIT